MKKGSLVEQFSELKDPRQRIHQEHKFMDIIVIAICGTLCGADDWVVVEQFGRAKVGWFRTFLELPNGIPAMIPFGVRVPWFEHCFRKWIATLQQLSTGKLIAVDGKQLRRSQDGAEAKPPSSWLVLGPVRINWCLVKARLTRRLTKSVRFPSCSPACNCGVAGSPPMPSIAKPKTPRPFSTRKRLISWRSRRIIPCSMPMLPCCLMGWPKTSQTTRTHLCLRCGDTG